MKTVDVVVELRACIARKYVTQSAAARAWGVSDAFVSAVLKGHKKPTQQMLDEAGLKRVDSETVYVKVKGRQ
jgi:hypothetical protein